MQQQNRTRVIERLLNLRQGDLGRGLPLFFYHFLIVSALVIGQVVRDTLFLDRFQAGDLPYVDMTIAAFVLLTVFGYGYVRQYTTLRTLHAGSLVGFAIIAGLFWLATLIYKWTWLYPALYIWVGIFGVLAPAQMWLLIIHLLSTRDKRLLGIVASGGIAGGMAGFVSSIVVYKIDAEHLLFVMMSLLVLCTILVVRVWRQWDPRVTAMESSTGARVAGASSAWNLRESLRQVRASTHLQTIAALVCLSAVVTNIVGWQFKATAAEFFLEKNDLAAFFGTFYGYVSMVGFVVAQIVAPRLLVLSLRVALLVLPIALVAGTVGVLTLGTLWATTVLKASDKILRYSLEKPAVESLYFPVPSNIMTQAKIFIDTVMLRTGDGLAGLIVFIFANILNLSARQISWVTLLLLGVWFIVIYVARRQYVETLGTSLQRHRLDVELNTTRMLDRVTTEMIAARLRQEDTSEILYALSLIDYEQHVMLRPTVRDLLAHSAAEVREKVVSLLNEAGDKTVISQVEPLLHDEHPGVRTEALLYLVHHLHVDPLSLIQQLEDFPDFSVCSGIITYLARSDERGDIETARQILHCMIQDRGPEGLRGRLEAARLLESMPDLFEDELETLVNDTNTKVAVLAIRAIGAGTTPGIISSVLDRLGEPDLTSEAVETLGRCGDGIVDLVSERLVNGSTPIEIRREIPRVLLNIGTVAAKKVLMESLLVGDTKLRSQIIASLASLQSRHPDFDLDVQMIESLVVAEIIGHYRSYQIQETLDKALDRDNGMFKALQESMKNDLERIFQLIKLLNPEYDLKSAYVGIHSDSPQVRANALEFLEHILKPELRNLLVPALDPDVSSAKRAQLTERLIGATMETPTEALLALMDDAEPWLKSNAVYTIGILGLTALEPKIDECLEHSDPLLRETARQAKKRLASSSKTKSPESKNTKSQ